MDLAELIVPLRSKGNREAQRERYALRYPGKALERTRAWKLAHPELVRAQKQRAYQRRKGTA
jgi:hypothetical protein